MTPVPTACLSPISVSPLFDKPAALPAIVSVDDKGVLTTKEGPAGSADVTKTKGRSTRTTPTTSKIEATASSLRTTWQQGAIRSNSHTSQSTLSASSVHRPICALEDLWPGQRFLFQRRPQQISRDPFGNSWSIAMHATTARCRRETSSSSSSASSLPATTRPIPTRSRDALRTTPIPSAIGSGWGGLPMTTRTLRVGIIGPVNGAANLAGTTFMPYISLLTDEDFLDHSQMALNIQADTAQSFFGRAPALSHQFHHRRP